MMSTQRRRTGAGSAARLAAAVALVTAVGALSGCFGASDRDGGEGPVPAARSTTPAAPLHVRAGVTRVVGELSPHARKHLADRAGALVAGYFRAAFLQPASERGSGPAMFPGFTSGARALADRDRDVLTAARYADAERITPERATAYINVLAPKGHPVGATVRVALAMGVTAGGRTREVDVAGRLLLTPTSSGWKVFGYDLSQSGRHARSTR